MFSRIAQPVESGQEEIKLISSVVDIEIRTPTPEELNDAFREAVAASAPDGDRKQQLSTSQAIQRLRFLDTDASRRKLRDILGEPLGFQGEAMLGLIGTREVDASMALLLDGLTAPDVAITRIYFDSLATLRRSQRGEVATTSPKFGHLVNPWGDIEDWKKLIQCFDQKTGRACDVSAMTLFERVRYEAENAELDLEDRLDHDAAPTTIRVPLAARFDRLQHEDQRQLLRSSWEFIRCPEFIPPLRPIVAAPMEQPDFAESNSVRSLALLRYVELEPVVGGIILEDIRRPRPNYSLEVLRALPLEQVQGELPLLAANFASEEADLEKIAGMIAHYGDRSIYDAVKARYLAVEGRWACATQKFCLSYFLKVQRAEGLALAVRAMTLREQTHCYRSVPVDVLEPIYGPDVEAKLLEVLAAEHELAVIREITDVLTRKGGGAVIDPLLDVLQSLTLEMANSGFFRTAKVTSARQKLLDALLNHTLEDLIRISPKLRWDLSVSQKERLQACLVSEREKEEFDRAFGG